MAHDEMQPYGELLETTVRVVSWNTWSQFGPWEERERVLLDNLRTIEPDIVCLQEAWEVGADNQPERFAAALGLRAGRGPTSDYQGVLNGQAVLSRWPITMIESMVAGEDEHTSGALFVRIDGPRGPIDVVSVILTWRLDHSAVRSAHLREILSWARELADLFHPLFVCGDFNSEPDSDEQRAMVGRAPVHAPNMVFYDALAMCIEGDRSTFTERNPYSAIGLYGDKAFDQIYSQWPKAHGAGHPIAAAVIGDEPVDGIWASDHFGVMADLRY